MVKILPLRIFLKHLGLGNSSLSGQVISSDHSIYLDNLIRKMKIEFSLEGQVLRDIFILTFPRSGLTDGSILLSSV